MNGELTLPLKINETDSCREYLILDARKRIVGSIYSLEHAEKIVAAVNENVPQKNLQQE